MFIQGDYRVTEYETSNRTEYWGSQSIPEEGQELSYQLGLLRGLLLTPPSPAPHPPRPHSSLLQLFDALIGDSRSVLLVPCGCSTKHYKLGGLKQQTFLLSVVEAGSLKSAGPQALWRLWQSPSGPPPAAGGHLASWAVSASPNLYLRLHVTFSVSLLLSLQPP